MFYMAQLADTCDRHLEAFQLCFSHFNQSLFQVEGVSTNYENPNDYIFNMEEKKTLCRLFKTFITRERKMIRFLQKNEQKNSRRQPRENYKTLMCREYAQKIEDRASKLTYQVLIMIDKRFLKQIASDFCKKVYLVRKEREKLKDTEVDSVFQQ